MDTAAQFEKYKNKAKKIFKDDEKINSLIHEGTEKISQLIASSEKMQELVKYMQLIIRMLKAYLNKTYTEIPWKTILAFGAALLYFVTPIDVIPDFIPGLGYIDDLTLLMWVIRSFGEDIEGYQQWEEGITDI